MANLQKKQKETQYLYNLNDINNREKVKELEKELEKIEENPEKKVYSFEFWLLQKGYITRAEIKRSYYSGGYGGELGWSERPVNYRVTTNIDEAYKLRKALDILQAKREFAQKQQYN